MGETDSEVSDDLVEEITEIPEIRKKVEYKKAQKKQGKAWKLHRKVGIRNDHRFISTTTPSKYRITVQKSVRYNKNRLHSKKPQAPKKPTKKIDASQSGGEKHGLYFVFKQPDSQ